MFSFIETKLFTRVVQEYLTDDEYSELQWFLAGAPESGPVIQGDGWSTQAQMAGGWAGQAGWLSRHLLCEKDRRCDLDADYVSEESCGRHPGACPSTDSGGD